MDKSGLMTFYVAAQFIAEKLVDSNMWSDMRQNKSQQDFFFLLRGGLLTYGKKYLAFFNFLAYPK